MKKDDREEIGEMYLLFVFEEGTPKGRLTFRMGEDGETTRREDRVYYNLDFEI